MPARPEKVFHNVLRRVSYSLVSRLMSYGEHRSSQRLDKLRCDDIRRESVVKGIWEFIERGQLRWFGHVKRMEEERYPRIFLECRLQGRRPVRRPNMRWKKHTKRGLRRRGVNLQEIEEEKMQCMKVVSSGNVSEPRRLTGF
ncbi:uncharacterized protein [Palaemon carinicauda]|uniref:uncharacterized protein n=1 Tax=Palaemon carinicauda TaxID=392227 RepID=UPI0035B658D0